jgi:hypothetical protein
MNAIPPRTRRFSAPRVIKVSVPDGAKGDWRVETFEITEREASFSSIRAVMHPEEAVRPGVYKRLAQGGQTWMSNTTMEVRCHAAFIEAAAGRVLINGLGLGMGMSAILKKPSVERVVVVEKHSEVIDLVWPTYSADSRVEIVHADALKWTPPKGAAYDCVWHDIWCDFSGDHLPDLLKLQRKYASRAKWQDSWLEEGHRLFGVGRVR